MHANDRNGTALRICGAGQRMKSGLKEQARERLPALTNALILTILLVLSSTYANGPIDGTQAQSDEIPLFSPSIAQLGGHIGAAAPWNDSNLLSFVGIGPRVFMLRVDAEKAPRLLDSSPVLGGLVTSIVADRYILIAAAGDRLYQLQAVNLLVPPVDDIAFGPDKIVVNRRYVYALDQNEIAVVYVHQREGLVRQPNVPLPEGLHAVDLLANDDRLYISVTDKPSADPEDQKPELLVYALNDPVQPDLIGRHADAGWGALAVPADFGKQSTIYSYGHGGLVAYDWTDPVSPVEIRRHAPPDSMRSGTFHPDGNPLAVTSDGRIFFVASDFFVHRLLTLPPVPLEADWTKVGTLESFSGGSFAADQRLLIAGDRFANIRTISSDTLLEARLRTTGSLHSVALEPARPDVLLAAGSGGPRTIDISQSLQPSLLGSPTSETIQVAAYAKGLLGLLVAQSGGDSISSWLELHDISNPSELHRIAGGPPINEISTHQTIAWINDYVFTLDRGRIKPYDLGDRRSFRELPAIERAGDYIDLQDAGDGSTLLALRHLSEDKGLVLDFIETDPSQGFWVKRSLHLVDASWSSFNKPLFESSGGHAFVVLPKGDSKELDLSLEIYDLGPGAGRVNLASIDLSEDVKDSYLYSGDIVYDDGYLFIRLGDVRIFDVRDPSSPREVGRIATEGWRGPSMTVHMGKVYVAAEQQGLMVYEPPLDWQPEPLPATYTPGPAPSPRPSSTATLTSTATPTRGAPAAWVFVPNLNIGVQR